MTQDTQNKMAAILAAAQEKAKMQTTVNFAPKAAQQTPKEFDNLKDIEQAAKNGEVISILNLSNLVNNRKPEVKDIFPELSDFTIEDLLNETPDQQPNTPEVKKANLTIVDYSDKAFAVIGETKAVKAQLRALGGRFNMYLTCGIGWIFPKTKLDLVKATLSL